MLATNLDLSIDKIKRPASDIIGVYLFSDGFWVRVSRRLLVRSIKKVKATAFHGLNLQLSPAVSHEVMGVLVLVDWHELGLWTSSFMSKRLLNQNIVQWLTKMRYFLARVVTIFRSAM